MNLTLWSLLALMALIALLLAILPLWRGAAELATSRRQTNIRIYRERLAELEAEQAAGRIDEEQKQLQVNELGRRLLDESQARTLVQAHAVKARPWWISVTLALGLPALAFGLYWSAGTWKTPTQAPELPYLAQQLEMRVAQHPEDAQAWVLLGRARRALNDPAQAAQAFRQANALMDPPQVAVLLQEVEAATLAANGDLTGGPDALLQQVLVREPQNVEALWLAGLAARQKGDAAAARRFWSRLLQQELPAEFAQTVRDQITRLPEN